jgi:hypothetical protein
MSTRGHAGTAVLPSELVAPADGLLHLLEIGSGSSRTDLYAYDVTG